MKLKLPALWVLQTRSTKGESDERSSYRKLTKIPLEAKFLDAKIVEFRTKGLFCREGFSERTKLVRGAANGLRHRVDGHVFEHVAICACIERLLNYVEVD